MDTLKPYQIRNKICEAALDLTIKNKIGFTREDVVGATGLPKVDVDFWISRLIESDDILVDTAGMLRVHPGFIG